MFRTFYRAARQFVENVETLSQSLSTRDKSTEELNSGITRLLKVYEDEQAERTRRAAARNQLALLLGEGSDLVRTQNFAAIQSWEERTSSYLSGLEPSFNLRFQNPNTESTSSRSRDVMETLLKARTTLLNNFISELQD